MSDCSWKENWGDTKQHFRDWWAHEGLVVTGLVKPASPAHAVVADPGSHGLVEAYADGEWRALRNHHAISKVQFLGDTLPISDTNIGPGSLALFLGSKPGFSPETVWFEPCMMEVEHPESLPPLKFDPDCKWWRVTEATCRACAELGEGKYLTGCPDLVENIDIISALRDPQTLMIDMIERPGWVSAKVAEINQAFFEAYDRIYDIIKLPDGSACFGAFGLWGEGKTAKVQCDACAMFSPDMFKQFVVPALTEQCEWLDYSMYHLDGTQCIDKLDHLLAIDALDAIEWTPQSGIEPGGDPLWFDMYQRILDAGKSVQIVGAGVDHLEPLFDTVGPKGLYVALWSVPERDVDRALKIVERYR